MKILAEWLKKLLVFNLNLNQKKLLVLNLNLNQKKLLQQSQLRKQHRIHKLELQYKVSLE